MNLIRLAKKLETNEHSKTFMVTKGSKVRILRKESYWYNKIGVVISVEKDSMIRYPVVIRFDSVNYSGTNTNNFGLVELFDISN